MTVAATDQLRQHKGTATRQTPFATQGCSPSLTLHSRAQSYFPSNKYHLLPRFLRQRSVSGQLKEACTNESRRIASVYRLNRSSA
jgi:hypothetical protein